MAEPSGNYPTETTTSEVADLKAIIEILNRKIETQNSPAWEKYREFQVARYQTQIDAASYRAKVFEWQLFASNVMLGLVVVVVLSGLGLSALQLWTAMKLGHRTDGTVDVSTNGIKVTSSIIGISILAISIAFILIFSHEIYDVKELRP